MITFAQTEKHRYLVAKYAPDVQRLEPKNIGIILWSHGRVVARFLSPDDAKFVRDKKNYARWVKYWNRQIDAGKLQSPQFEGVQIDSPKFIDALIETQKGNYILLDGGILMDDIGEDEINDAAVFLFERLVADSDVTDRSASGRTVDAERLKSESAQVFKQTGLWDRPDFHKGDKGYNVPCRFNDVWKELRFHYALGEGNPNAVFHMIDLTLDSSWERAALRFEHLQSSNKLGRERCGALVHLRHNGKPPDDELQKNHEIIDAYANMIDVADEKSAADAIQKIIQGL